MRALKSTEMMNVNGGEYEYINMHELPDLKKHFIEVDILKGKIEWHPEDNTSQNLKELTLIGALITIAIIAKSLCRISL